MGRFSEYSLSGSFITYAYVFTIDLSAVGFSDLPSGGSLGRSPILCELHLRPAEPLNPTSPNDLTVHLSGDFTDTDGDGMTDAAERKYGFDAQDALSFPTEPELIAKANPERHEIEDSGVGAYYEVTADGFTIRWTDPEDSDYYLLLRTEGSSEWNIYRSGHYIESAEVDFSTFNLSGNETLEGEFQEYIPDRNSWQTFPRFVIDLSAVEFPEPHVPGDPSNRISYTFSSEFPPEAEIQYREFLKRVFPLLYEHLGPPAETLNVFIDYAEYRDAFLVIDGGRTLLTDASFIPRLIVHEFVHAWKGQYAITSDENWEHDDSLTGFEEATAEGMAFEIIHEYVRSYPDDPATIQLLEGRPHQYWSSGTTRYDAMKNIRWTGAGDFWTHNGGQTNRYSIAATTFQMMIQENPSFMREFMSLYYETIRSDPDWRPNRADVIDMWETLVPELNGYPLGKYLNTLPVFNGHKLDEGVYILETIRAYGESGDQQFALAYAIPDGRLWWGIREEELQSVPKWISTSLGEDEYYYIDTQGASFAVDVTDAHGKEYATYTLETEWDRRPDGAPRGFGWHSPEELEMEDFPIGLYKETVTFTDYVEHDEGARDSFYFFGLKGFEQAKGRDYVVMIGVDGVPEGTARIELLGEEHTTPISNGVAVFSSTEWPFDIQGRFPITITNAEGESREYHRTLIEAGTIHNFFQHQFIIVDTDFNGVEDQFE